MTSRGDFTEFPSPLHLALCEHRTLYRGKLGYSDTIINRRPLIVVQLAQSSAETDRVYCAELSAVLSAATMAPLIRNYCDTRIIS